MNAIGTACNFRRHYFHGVKDEFRLSARLTIRVIRKVADSYRTEFAQQRYDIEYKAKLSGVPMVPVDPAYTSQRCSVCGFVHEDNGKTQASFVCLSCGHAEHADLSAAKNIRKDARAAVNRPMVVRPAEASA